MSFFKYWFAAGLTVLALLVPSAAMAEGEAPRGRFRAAGEITAVTPGQDTFELHSRRGRDLTIEVDEDTQFRSVSGDIDGLSDLEIGMRAMVAGQVEDGAYIARVVGVAKPGERDGKQRAAGVVTRVVAGQGTFTLEARSGDSLTFHTSDDTRWISRDGSVQGIHDLKKDMRAGVIYTPGQDGELLALAVAVAQPGDRGDRPRPDVRAAGVITELGNRQFTIRTRRGEQLTFKVTGDTMFRSRSGEVDGFEDLEVGMKVGVAGNELGSGDFMALLVVAPEPNRIGAGDGPRREGRPGAAGQGRPFEGAPQPQVPPPDSP